MSSTKPANLSTTSKDFPQEILDQLNYIVSDIYSWISELRGLDGFKHDANSSTQYITAADVTFENLNTNGGVGTQSDQVASGDRGVENGSNHDHSGGDGGSIAHSSLSSILPTWIAISSFGNSWVNYGAPHGDAAYCKDGHGFVHLRGVIKDGTVGSSAFTLPSDFRPASQILQGAISNGAIGRVDIGTDGTVSPLLPSNNTWVSLDGIAFYAG
jgi:hypothetical protein